MTRETYPSDVTDDEWAFIASYLTLMREDAPQRAQIFAFVQQRGIDFARRLIGKALTVKHLPTSAFSKGGSARGETTAVGAATGSVILRVR